MLNEQEKPDFDVQQYLNTIASYDKEFKKWEGRVEKILKRYRDDFRNGSRGYTEARYNILWSNVQTLKAATFARIPKPDVSRRFRDNDPVGRVAALLLERALEYEIQHYQDYRSTLESALTDRFLGGRGIAWVRYEPKFTPLPNGEDYEGDEITEDVHLEGQAEEQQAEVIDYECAPTDYVHWKDFGHSVARTWEEVNCVWRKVYMTREMLRERFPDLADSIPLDASPDELKNSDGVDKRALVYEIWDKETGNAYWLSKSMGKFLDVKQDPLELENFFPCPKPLYSTITNESLVPIPDFALYQDQANELDVISDRIDGLIKALQVKGVYDASQPEIGRLFTEGENNTLIPVKNWAAFAEKQGLKGAIELVDLVPIAQALNYAYSAMQQVKEQIYDITGISDIIRGQSMASETATAQQIKGQYASLRLKSYQEDVARFAAEMLRLKAQIICQHFDDQTIYQISGAQQLNPSDVQLVPQAIQLLRNEPMRNFRIDISTDSLINMDEAQEKQDRIEFLTAVSGFLEKAVAAGQQAPQIVPLIMDLLKFGVTGFRIGKTIEGEIDDTADQMKQVLAQQQNQPPKPDPEQIKMQADQQAQQQQMQVDMQKKQMEAQVQQQRNQMEAERENMRLQLEQAKHLQQMEFERWKVEKEAETQIIIAQIKANTIVSKQQDDAADMAIADEGGEYGTFNQAPQEIS